MKLVADILGILGILITVFVYQQKKREKMLLSKLILDLVWMLHYCFIGAYSGAVVAVIAAVREIVFVKRDPKKANGIIWLPIFIVVAIVSTILTWNNIFSIFTLLASCTAVVSFFIGKPNLSRILAFPVSLCMLTYDIACNSIAGIVNESFAIISSLVGIIRLDIKCEKEYKETENVAETE